MTAVLRISAVRILDASGRILLVRKRGTGLFMQPGGKLERGETPAGAAARELGEELGMTVAAAELEPLGHWLGPAANEPDTLIDSHLFAAPLRGLPQAAAELEELLWIDPAQALLRDDIAPLLREHVLPELLAARASG
ncbi:NUDIX hydrolase [Zafaria sp. Z1313]|uniref:NUDIX hydrolase n=1 Tax=unclassified Zafaria TaxID=2828765 RepID=UPI003D30340C